MFVKESGSWKKEYVKQGELNVVFEKCYDHSFEGVEIENPSTDGWGGLIEVKKKNETSSWIVMGCPGCTNGSSAGNVFVDKNHGDCSECENLCIDKRCALSAALSSSLWTQVVNYKNTNASVMLEACYDLPFTSEIFL